MPYDSNKDVPSAVKKLPAKKQSQWRHVWNSTFKKTGDESRAFAAANSVAGKKKEIEIDKGYLGDLWDVEKRQIEQDDASYQPFGGTAEKACLNCHWYVMRDDACVIVHGDIVHTGISDYWMAIEEPEVYVQPVTIVKDENNNVVSKIGDWITRTFTFAPESLQSNFILTKQANGSWRWFSRYSNMFKDREGEILTNASHKEFAEWCTSTNNYPELWLWHAKGSRIGKADFMACVDGFACASGLIDDRAKAIAEALSVGKAGRLGASHGFLPLAMQKGVCSQYRSFEITVLPYDRAANGYTDYNFLKVKGEDMPFTDAHKAFFKNAGVPDEQVTAWEASTAQFAKSLQEMGLEYKEDPTTGDNPIGTLLGQQSAMTKAITDLTTVVADLKKADKEKVDAAVANAFTPIVAPTDAVPASKADDNIVGTAEVNTSLEKEQKEFFENAFGVKVTW